MNDLLYNIISLQEKLLEIGPMIANLENVINCANNGEDVEMKERRQIIVGRNEDGTPIYKTLNAKSQDEMNLKIAQMLINSSRAREISIPQNTLKQRITLKEYADQWMKRKRKLKKTTIANYTKYLDEYIIPTLGDKYLNEISSLAVQQLLDRYDRLSKSTLKNMKGILSQIMKYAVNDDLIDKNPCDDLDIEIPSDKKKERKALPIAEYKGIISNFNQLIETDKCFLGLCMYTAMRRGEILGLKWEDIYDNCIHVVRNVTHPQQNQPVITTPKTAAGVRTIPLSPALKDLLGSSMEHGFIFGGDKPYSLSAFRNMWERINKTIDMHGATPHVLRHSYLTYAVGETTDYKTVQGISGHADLKTLLNIYAHPQEEKIKSLSDKMDDLLK